MGYNWFQGVTYGYRGFQMVTTANSGLQGVSGGYRKLQGDTKGYRGYKGLHGLQMIAKNLFYNNDVPQILFLGQFCIKIKVQKNSNF